MNAVSKYGYHKHPQILDQSIHTITQPVYRQRAALRLCGAPSVVSRTQIVSGITTLSARLEEESRVMTAMLKRSMIDLTATL
jgi:hypothetical protein